MTNIIRFIRSIFSKPSKRSMADFYFPWLNRYRKSDGSYFIPAFYDPDFDYYDFRLNLPKDNEEAINKDGGVAL